MRIGIDAKWYFEGPPSGKRVVKGLVDYMLKIDEENEYFIFLNKKHQREEFSHKGKKNVKIYYIWAGNNFLSNVFVLPFYSHKYSLSATLYQNFISPFDSGKKIAYIHDVLFLSNPEYYTIYERLYFAPLKFLTRKCDVIITVSEEEKKRLLRFRFSDHSRKIAVVYHGVDSSFTPSENVEGARLEDTKRKFNLPDKFLLYVGRLNLRKNIDNLLRSVPLLNNKTIPLIIVGADDWKKSNHLQIIRFLGIERRVHFTGAVYKELSMIYSLATLFCFPSFAESFGLPPLEAMACGVPVVVSDTTSLPEICADAGTYADPCKPEQIASAIDMLLTDELLYASKRSLGIARAKEFTWDRAAKTSNRMY